MTDETQALIDRLAHAGEEMSAAAKRQWDGNPALKISIPARPDYDTDLIVRGALGDAAAALTTLARDLETARQEREAVEAARRACHEAERHAPCRT